MHKPVNLFSHWNQAREWGSTSPAHGVFGVLKAVLSNTVCSWNSWKEDDVFLFLHAVKTFSLETEGFREWEKAAEGVEEECFLWLWLSLVETGWLQVVGREALTARQQSVVLCPLYTSALSTLGLKGCLVWCLCRLACWAWALEQLSWVLKSALTLHPFQVNCCGGPCTGTAGLLGAWGSWQSQRQQLIVGHVLKKAFRWCWRLPVSAKWTVLHAVPRASLLWYVPWGLTDAPLGSHLCASHLIQVYLHLAEGSRQAWILSPFPQLLPGPLLGTNTWVVCCVVTIQSEFRPEKLVFMGTNHLFC